MLEENFWISFFLHCSCHLISLLLFSRNPQLPCCLTMHTLCWTLSPLEPELCCCDSLVDVVELWIMANNINNILDERRARRGEKKMNASCNVGKAVKEEEVEQHRWELDERERRGKRLASLVKWKKNTFSFSSCRLVYDGFSLPSPLFTFFLINLLSCDFHVVKYQVSCIRWKERHARKEERERNFIQKSTFKWFRLLPSPIQSHPPHPAPTIDNVLMLTTTKRWWWWEESEYNGALCIRS